MAKLYERIRDIDRRVVFLFIALSVIIPLLYAVRFPEFPTPMVQGVFDAVAAGTFLYVAVLGIIEREFTQPKDRWLKFILLAFGLGIMAVLAIWA